jgi:hypothetical protein
MLPVLKEVMTSLSSIIAIILSFIALTITIKNRRNAMRETIYIRQLEAIEALKVQINESEKLAHQYFFSNERDANEHFKNMKESSKEAIYDAHSKLMELLELKVIILPTDIFVEIQEYNDLIFELITNPQGEKLDEISTKYINIENVMRDFIGWKNSAKKTEN